jgi:hypothetical protein
MTQICGACQTEIQTCPVCNGKLCTDGCPDRKGEDGGPGDGCTCG